MKIMYVTDQFYLHGGIEKMLSLKIKHWIEDYQYEVILCTSEHRGNPFVYPVPDTLQWIDLGIDYDRRKSYFTPQNLSRAWVHYRKLKKLIAHHKPDAVISINYTPEQYFLPFLGRHIPKIKEFHSSGAVLKKEGSFGGKLKSELFNLYNKYDAQVVLNPDEKKYYPFANVVVIPNFVDPVPKEFALREKTVIAAGRIAPVKQFDHLLRAWSLICEKNPEWTLKIFGDGDVRHFDKLKALLHELNLKNAFLMGPSDEMPREMANASLYAMTSSSECFPMVLLEAQQQGLPVLSYDCPNGPRNIITSGIDGMLTPPNEIDIFAQTMQELLGNQQLLETMGAKAKENAQRFEPKVVMEIWNELILKLISN